MDYRSSFMARREILEYRSISSMVSVSMASSSPFFAASIRLFLFLAATFAIWICFWVFLMGRRIFPPVENPARLMERILKASPFFSTFSL